MSPDRLWNERWNCFQLIFKAEKSATRKTPSQSLRGELRLREMSETASYRNETSLRNFFNFNPKLLLSEMKFWEEEWKNTNATKTFRRQSNSCRNSFTAIWTKGNVLLPPLVSDRAIFRPNLLSFETIRLTLHGKLQRESSRESHSTLSYSLLVTSLDRNAKQKADSVECVKQLE